MLYPDSFDELTHHRDGELLNEAVRDRPLELLDVADATLSPRVRAYALVGAALLAFLQGDYGAAITERALERAHQVLGLDALDVAPPDPTRGQKSDRPDAVLSPREREVLLLLVRDFSNRQIAEELVIGVRTAETHVERVLRKLGLAKRTQTTRWAQAHGWLDESVPAADGFHLPVTERVGSMLAALP